MPMFDFRESKPIASPHLSFLSLSLDEKARSLSPPRSPMNKLPRFKAKIVNGNMAPLILVPEADMGTITGFVDTNTRTVFQDVLCYAEGTDTIKEYIDSPESRNTVVEKREGHFPLNSYAPTDPRVQHLRPNPELGPGTYTLDSLHIPYHRDSTRASPHFKSPPRSAASPEPRPSAADPLPLDFDSWTSRGFYSSHSPARTPQRTNGTSLDVVYDNAFNLTSDGRAACCAASLALSPGAQSSFQSMLPKLYSPKPTTSADIAPGVYSLEPPRFRSHNQAYANTAPLESLASVSSDNNTERRLSRPLSPIKIPPPVMSKSYPSAPNSPLRLKHGAIPCEKSSELDADWRCHESLTRSHFAAGLSNDEDQEADGLAGEADFDPVLKGKTSSPGIIDDTRIAECSAAMRAQMTYTTQYGAAASHLRQQRFGNLVFSKRDTPHQVLIKTKIQAKEDVKRARQALLEGRL